jgi:hypothetical protein
VIDEKDLPYMYPRIDADDLTLVALASGLLPVLT